MEICSCKELKLKATCAWVAPGSEKDESKKQRRKRHMRDGRNILVAPKHPCQSQSSLGVARPRVSILCICLKRGLVLMGSINSGPK